VHAVTPRPHVRRGTQSAPGDQPSDTAADARARSTTVRRRLPRCEPALCLENTTSDVKGRGREATVDGEHTPNRTAISGFVARHSIQLSYAPINEKPPGPCGSRGSRWVQE
jgi:hypothetical protein